MGNGKVVCVEKIQDDTSIQQYIQYKCDASGREVSRCEPVMQHRFWVPLGIEKGSLFVLVSKSPNVDNPSNCSRGLNKDHGLFLC